jgi:transketolase
MRQLLINIYFRNFPLIINHYNLRVFEQYLLQVMLTMTIRKQQKLNKLPTHHEMANAIRFLSIDAVQKANSGHPGLPMGMADVSTVLFRKYLKFNPKDPDWDDRDRFILSAGHGSMLLYSLLYLTGYKGSSLKDIINFRQLNSRCAGHPEYGHLKGIETTTGPLGQGFANAVGMAIAERKLSKDFGSKICDHFTYIIASDGDLMEGISHEAASLAGHLKLKKLIVFFDDNGISIDGPVSLSNSENTVNRFKAYQWNTISINGHDQNQISKAISKAQKSNKPTLIACKTKIGFGSPNKQGKSSAHGAPLGLDEIELTKAKLNWEYKPFEIPDNIKSEWLIAGTRSILKYKKWKSNANKMKSNSKKEYARRINGKLPSNINKILNDFKKDCSNKKIAKATRQSSEMVINQISSHMPELIGGSADLTGSNNTKASDMKILDANNYSGNYIYYGIREHGMAAIMNGIALHKGVIPFSGTFLIFSDYCKPSIRLSALMKQRVIYVFTHDSIGLGEDGPTHQPIEQLAGLRSIPNLNVFRPADSVETAEAWQISLQSNDTPSAIALTRQSLPTIREKHVDKNLTAFGAYEIQKSLNKPRVSIFASGSEVEIALEVSKLLKKNKIKSRVISVPCLDKFEEQTSAYKKKIIGDSDLNVSIEAGSDLAWEKLCPKNRLSISMNTFGASAPYKKLYEYFGISPQKIYKKIINKL